MRRLPWPVWALVAVVVAGAVTAVVVTSRQAGKPDAAPRASSYVWSDEFSGPAGAAPDPAIWGFQTGETGRRVGQLQCYTASRKNSYLDGHGDLVISARRDPGHDCGGDPADYTSARLTSASHRTLRYGHLRVRALLPTAPGMWSAIWALGTGADWPRSGEIDVCETLGSQPDVVHATVHGPTSRGHPYSLSAAGNAAPGRFHVYGLDWTPEAVSFGVDGRVFRTFTRAEVQRHGQWVFDKPFYVLLSLAIGGAWPGPPTAETTWPQRMVVDYVRVYR